MLASDARTISEIMLASRCCPARELLCGMIPNVILGNEAWDEATHAPGELLQSAIARRPAAFVSASAEEKLGIVPC
jgi:hypothetical protein